MTATQSDLPAPRLAAPAPPRGRLDLFLISFVILFFELACIRWFGSTVVFLTFFTNIVLIACFLGMTVGCLAASRKADLLKAVLPLTLLAVGLAWLVLWAYSRYDKITIDVGRQEAPQLIFFGSEYRAKNPGQWVVPIELIAGVFFALIALIFVGLGQVMGRAFDALPNRVLAYTTNILGSLAGIVAFAACSYLTTPPLVWFAVCVPIVLVLLRRRPWWQLACGLLVLTVVGINSYVPAEIEGGKLFWSPYYKIRYRPQNGEILTNNITHQHMMEVREWGPAYALPHLLNRDATPAGETPRPFERVLIIGAGSGNDVSSALRFGAQNIDAVEIDPTIYKLGTQHHPDHPYANPNVHIHLDDGRSFARHMADAPAEEKYDLASYALVDSLVLHSGYSSLRLESFLFTREAFADIRNTLKPGGVFVMYNYYRQWWVVARLAAMAKDVFGTEPLVISMPYEATIDPQQVHKDRFTMILVGKPVGLGSAAAPSPVVERIRRKFADAGYFWLNDRSALNEPREFNGFGRAAPPPVATAPAPDAPGTPGLKATDRPENQPAARSLNWRQIGVAAVPASTLATAEVSHLPEDNWPFLYLAKPVIPELSIRGMAIIAVLALAILFAFAPVRAIRPNGQMFFLGAGFMLLETKGVVHLALLMGSTWMVNSVVFFAILVLILLANLYVLAVQPRRVWPYYLLLAAALLVNALVPMHTFLALPGAGALRMVASCAVVFVPIFFAGVIFATAFRDSKQPDIDMGSNIGGVILGGLSEYCSLLVGFNYLILIALAYYALSAVLRPRVKLPAVPAVS